MPEHKSIQPIEKSGVILFINNIINLLNAYLFNERKEPEPYRLTVILHNLLKIDLQENLHSNIKLIAYLIYQVFLDHGRDTILEEVFSKENLAKANPYPKKFPAINKEELSTFGATCNSTIFNSHYFHNLLTNSLLDYINNLFNKNIWRQSEFGSTLSALINTSFPTLLCYKLKYQQLTFSSAEYYTIEQKKLESPINLLAYYALKAQQDTKFQLVVDLLEEDIKAIDTDDQQLNVLHYLAKETQIAVDSSVFKTFINKGVYINAQSKNGYTPLHLAESVETAKILINLGANIHQTDHHGRSILEIIDARIKDDVNKKMTLLKFYYQQGVSTSQQNTYSGNTLLHSAVQKEVWEWLLETKTDINITNKQGDTALHVAIRAGKKQPMDNSKINFLLENGTNINLQGNNGYTPLHLAIQASNFELAEKLLDKGASVTITDRYGNTAAHYAVFHQNFKSHYPKKEEDAKKLFSRIQQEQPSVLQSKNIYQLNAYNYCNDLSSHKALASSKITFFQSPENINLGAISVEQFDRRVKEFKETYNLKSIKMLFDEQNPNGEALRNRFFADPIISAYLLRSKLVLNDKGFGALLSSKYESALYKAMRRRSNQAWPGYQIPYRVEQRLNSMCISPEYDESGSLILEKNLCIERFDKTGSEIETLKFMAEKYFSNIPSWIKVIYASDIYGMENILDRVDKRTDLLESGFSLLIFPTAKDNHAIAFGAIVDNEKRSLRSIIFCNSWNHDDYFKYISERMPSNIPIIDVSHQIQTHANDRNCGLFSLKFSEAFSLLFQNDGDLWKDVTAYERSDRSVAVSLAKRITTGMKQYLPGYYDKITLEAKTPLEVVHANWQFRWEIGRLYLEQIINKSKTDLKNEETQLTQHKLM